MNKNGYQYDFGADEWHFECSACGLVLYAPTLIAMQTALPIHTTSQECLGGY